VKRDVLYTMFSAGLIQRKSLDCTGWRHLSRVRSASL